MVDDASSVEDVLYQDWLGRVEHALVAIKCWLCEFDDGFKTDERSDMADYGHRPDYSQQSSQRCDDDDLNGDKYCDLSSGKSKIKFLHFNGRNLYEVYMINDSDLFDKDIISRVVISMTTLTTTTSSSPSVWEKYRVDSHLQPT